MTRGVGYKFVEIGPGTKPALMGMLKNESELCAKKFEGVRYIGIDRSQQNVRRMELLLGSGRTHTEGLHSYEVRVGALGNLGLRARFADEIFMSNVFGDAVYYDHMPEEDPLKRGVEVSRIDEIITHVGELRKVIKKYGKLVVAEFTAPPEEKKLTKAITGAGFTVEKAIHIGDVGIKDWIETYSLGYGMSPAGFILQAKPR